MRFQLLVVEAFAVINEKLVVIDDLLESFPFMKAYEVIGTHDQYKFIARIFFLQLVQGINRE